MLKFLSKEFVWSCMDDGVHTELGWAKPDIHLKTWQDIAVYSRIKDLKDLKIAEIGGGKSRLLRCLSKNNTCYNVDKFAGQHGGPAGEFKLSGVTNVLAFMGEFNRALEDESFDIVCSVSVVEHVPDEGTKAFVDDMVRILKPGGLCLHAIDMYVGDVVDPGSQRRLDLYRSWFDRPDVQPLEPPEASTAVFKSWMATNPDFTMWTWNRLAPSLVKMRMQMQSTSLLCGFRKYGEAS
ncbi:class I SAM-dependent methyltransferase [Roseovarius mucosus]|uniref:methyltransferase domain-containing protein n=1 Tax=Roseovarius mucosus TaxID=215743 RepID=UPI001C5DEEA0|nr:methyltransferase domain-containing protein [Roseovarius mucosus]MBW4972311.1 class I SAM-dependent methyltransferase [Roseovarius mucosus]|tara:strand:+ start:135 stop:845 length:711 start_codon:yes stop_codon:yes gene_type:complete